MTRKRPLMKNLCFTCLEMTLVGWFLQRELGRSARLSHQSMSQHRQESVSLTADNGYQCHRSPIPRGLRHRGLQKPRLEVATAEGEKQLATDTMSTKGACPASGCSQACGFVSRLLLLFISFLGAFKSSCCTLPKTDGRRDPGMEKTIVPKWITPCALSS